MNPVCWASAYKYSFVWQKRPDDWMLHPLHFFRARLPRAGGITSEVNAKSIGPSGASAERAVSNASNISPKVQHRGQSLVGWGEEGRLWRGGEEG